MVITPLDYLIALAIVVLLIMFLVCCVLLVLIATIDNIRIQIKHARARQKRGTQCPS